MKQTRSHFPLVVAFAAGCLATLAAALVHSDPASAATLIQTVTSPMRWEAR